MSDRKYNLVVTDRETGEVVMNLKNVKIKSQRFSIEKPEDNADIVVDANVTGLLEEEVVVSDR